MCIYNIHVISHIVSPCFSFKYLILTGLATCIFLDRITKSGIYIFQPPPPLENNKVKNR